MGCRISYPATDPEEQPMRLRLEGSEDLDIEYKRKTASPEELPIKVNSEEKNMPSMIDGGNSDGSMWLCSRPLIDETTFQDSAKIKVYVDVIGIRMNPAQCGLGYACRKGMELHAQSNQDSWLILKTEGLSIYGVFCGKVSNFAKRTMPKLIIESKPFCYSAFRSKQHMTAMLKNVFQGTHNIIAAARGTSKVDAHITGTTCIITVHDHGNNRLYVAWTGDRGACIASSAGTAPDGGLIASDMTWDHKPWVGEEKAYINKVGGKIRDGGHSKLVNAKMFHYPSRNMTRCLTAGPTVDFFDLRADDCVGMVLLVFSDVVWDNISHAEALKVVACHPRSDAKGAAEKIAKIAWDKCNNNQDGRFFDDIVALVIHPTSYGLVTL